MNIWDFDYLGFLILNDLYLSFWSVLRKTDSCTCTFQQLEVLFFFFFGKLQCPFNKSSFISFQDSDQGVRLRSYSYSSPKISLLSPRSSRDPPRPPANLGHGLSIYLFNFTWHEMTLHKRLHLLSLPNTSLPIHSF